MNLILLYPSDQQSAQCYRLSNERARHLRETLQVTPGRKLRVGLLNGPLGEATVLSCGEDIHLSVEFFEPPPPPLVDLVLGIPRPKSLKKLLPEVAALGVGALVLLRSWRVAQPYLSSPLLTPEGWEPLLDEGLMQGCSTHRPQIQVEQKFRPFVEDRAPKQFAGARCLVAHPYGGVPLAQLILEPAERVVVAIGPEGGFIEPELASFAHAGFTPVALGQHILRVETACVAILAQLDLLRQQSRLRAGLPLFTPVAQSRPSL